MAAYRLHESLAVLCRDPKSLILQLGGVGEWLKPPVLKTGVHFVDREFESRPLRQPLFTAFPSVG
jgi:hypothetical protein